LKEFEVWRAKLPPPAGERPVLLLSREEAYAVLNRFIVGEITTTCRWSELTGREQ
jgi:mRNA interferase MazF